MQFRFIEDDPNMPPGSSLPFIKLGLSSGLRSIEVDALVDSGATVSVLPFEIGCQLGLNWNEQKLAVRLEGNLAKASAFGVLIESTVASCSAVPLVFAWTKMSGGRLILGQCNFFQYFDICFYRGRSVFEIKPKLK